MKYPFDPNSSLIRVWVQIHGMQAMSKGLFALDTGATQSMVHPRILMRGGYDPLLPTVSRTTNGIGGPVTMGILRVTAIRSLGRSVADLPLLIHRLPAPAGIDGLLGLDFLRQGGVHIDFRTGTIELD